MSMIRVGGAGMGALSNVERAQALKAVLDQVTTNEQAKAIGYKAYELLSEALVQLGPGISGDMFTGYFSPDLSGLQDALAGLPFFDGPVDGTWSDVPNGARRKIEVAFTDVATLAKTAPPGSLQAADAEAFMNGFTATLHDELAAIVGGARGIVGAALEGIGLGLQIPPWVWWAVGGVAVLYGVSKLKAIRELVT